MFPAGSNKAHFSEREILEDFLAVDQPEYVIQYIAQQTGYLETRAKDILIPLYEELLQKSLYGLEEKYSSEKVEELKGRLKLQDLE